MPVINVATDKLLFNAHLLGAFILEDPRTRTALAVPHCGTREAPTRSPHDESLEGKAVSRAVGKKLAHGETSKRVAIAARITIYRSAVGLHGCAIEAKRLRTA